MLSRTIAVASLLAVFCGLRIAAAAGTTMPSFDQVQKLVEKQLGTLADYRPGDIISQQQVAPIFDQLQRLGWTVRDRAEIMQLVPGDNEFIVRQLRTSTAHVHAAIEQVSAVLRSHRSIRPDGYG